MSRIVHPAAPAANADAVPRGSGDARSATEALQAARHEFYRNISHELATPLTPVVGYLQMLLAEELGPLTASQRKALTATEGCIRRLRSTLDDLLDVTGLETGRMRFVHRDYDFGDVVRRAIEASRAQLAERRLELVTELDPGPMPAWGDPDRLQRAARHLLDNAAKFTPHGGTVGVVARAIATGFELLVVDTGPGIPLDDAERVFEPFFQLDGSITRERGGVGTGLAIARRTARGLGGDVALRADGPLVVGTSKLTGSIVALTVATRAPSEATP
jgi:signal transduction histidine kinase